MRDPYLYEDADVMKNKLNIKNAERLEDAEASITLNNIATLKEFENGNITFENLKSIHKHIFGDIYEWAGKVRTIDIAKSELVLGGASVEYSTYKSIEKEGGNVIKQFNDVDWKKLNIDEAAEKLSTLAAKLWQVHPFREGNTRSSILFMENFAKTKGIIIDNDFLKQNSGYVRKSLVMASIGEYSEPGYLNKIIRGSIKKDRSLEINEIKEKIIDMYTKEFPAIKNIKEETAIIIDKVNNTRLHIHTIKEIKELHHDLGIRIENNDNKQGTDKIENTDIIENIEEFETLSTIIEDLKQSKLKLLQEQAHEKAAINQLTKVNSLEL